MDIKSTFFAITTLVALGNAHAETVRVCINHTSNALPAAVAYELPPETNAYLGACSPESYEHSLRMRAVTLAFCRDNPNDCDGHIPKFDEVRQETYLNLSDWNPNQRDVSRLVKILRAHDKTNSK